jgi:hypothetical protein
LPTSLSGVPFEALPGLESFCCRARIDADINTRIPDTNEKTPILLI